MPQAPDTPALPHTFRGALAFNQRTVAGAAAALLKETPAGQPIANQPITTNELINVLLVLESIATSTGMYLDGTLPPQDRKHLKDVLWRIGAQSGIPLSMEFINPPAADLPSLFSDAAEAASLLIAHDLEDLDSQSDEPLNSLAASRQAAYLADVSVEDLKATQVFLFARYLASKVAASDAEALTDATKRLFDRHFSAVPLGFAIFMNSEATSPLHLLEEAMKARDLPFSIAAAHATPQQRFIHQFTADEFASFQDYLFKNKWIALVNASERAEFTRSGLREVTIPAALGGTIGAIIGAIASGPAGAAAGSVAGSAIQYLAEQLATGRLGNRDVHADQYRRLKAYLALAAKNDRLATPFREKVEAVFGRPFA